MVVLPFRRKTPEPPQDDESSRCPECGWKLPASMSADPAHAGHRPGETFVLYITCPDCDARLVVPVAFR